MADQERVLADRYRLVRRISRTEMAEVYEAVDEVLGRRVAVKVLLPELVDNTDFVARFQREARAAASLNHPNIVSVYDSGATDDSYFIVMEYIDGPTLLEVINEDAPLPETRAAEIGMEIAAALSAAHAEGIVHRDVKPGNVLLGSAGIVKVVDFGIARAVSASTSELTRPGTIVGSVSYLSPEQALGQPVGPASDIYSLGTVLYVMATGQAPFAADTPIAVAHQHVHEPPTPPNEINPALSPAFSGLVMRAMAKDPADRPASAESMRQALLAIVEGATAPEAMSPEATAVLAAPTVAGSATQVLTTAVPGAVAAGPTLAERRRRAVAAFLIAMGVAIAVILLIAFLAKAMNHKNNDTTTTVPTTIPTTTTLFRRPIVTVPRTTQATEPVTTEAPTTALTVPQTSPPQTVPPNTSPTSPPNT